MYKEQTKKYGYIRKCYKPKSVKFFDYAVARLPILINKQSGYSNIHTNFN